MQKNKGFTLIELMVVIAIIAIVAMIAAPSFGDMITRQKLNSNTRALMGAFNLAKSQAALIKKSVVVCPNKTILGTEYTKADCATAGISNYAAMSATEKIDVQENRVIMVEIDKKVELKSGSTSKVVFNEIGSSGTQQTMSLCAGKELRLITILALGNVTQTIGSC